MKTPHPTAVGWGIPLKEQVFKKETKNEIQTPEK